MIKYLEVSIGPHIIKTKVHEGECAEDVFERVLERKYGRTAVAYPLFRDGWTVEQHGFCGYVRITGRAQREYKARAIENRTWVEVGVDNDSE